MNRNRKTKGILICSLVAANIILVAVGDAKADFVFGTPENLGPGVNSPGFETTAGISMDCLSFYFVRNQVELWVSKRATKDDPWGDALYLGSLMPRDISMTVSSIGFLATVTTVDGLEAYYSAQLSGGYGRSDIWFMKRETLDDSWGPLENLGPPVNTIYDEHLACVSPNGLELYFSGRLADGVRPGGYGYSDLWVTRRATRDASWTEPVNLGSSVNSAYADARPSISPDGLLLFFDSNRPGGFGSLDLYVSRRTSLLDTWGEPMNLGPLVNTAGIEECARILADGSTLYWDSDRLDGDNDLWQASIEPVADLNGDGIVDCTDMCIIVDNWGTDEPLCDIGPTPFGDGVVDAQDMLVLTEYLTKVDIESDIDAVEEVLSQYAAAVNTGDLDLYISIYTDDAVSMAPGAPATYGKEELRASIEPLFTNFTLEMTLYPEEAQVDGDLGFARGRYTLLITPKKGGASSFADGKYLTICKRQADGSWKISRECYNSNIPPA